MSGPSDERVCDWARCRFSARHLSSSSKRQSEPAGRISHGCLGLYSDANERALAPVVGFCRRAGSAALGIQLAHAGRKGSARLPWEGGGPLTPDPASPSTRPV
jgi:2,4-dienoyl-CoA reductase-like NADH-dependent reductase (Old Yellow Enzyme family)